MNLHNKIQLAFQSFQRGNFAHAEKLCLEILRLEPNNTHILHFLGIIYYQLQKYDAAVKQLKAVIQANPVDAEASYNLARAYQKWGKLHEAIACYQEAVKHNPYFIDAYLNLGNLFQEIKEFDKAVTCYTKIIEISPHFAGAYYNLGCVLQEKGLSQEAIFNYQKAIQINPEYADAYHDLGFLLYEDGKFDQAIECYEKTLQLNPQLFDAYNNLGRVLKEKGQIDQAIASYRQAIRINPDFAEAHANMSLALLLTGNFQEGWKEYEWRKKLKNRSLYHFRRPMWDGSDISGRTILLHAEQGLGDTIQFIRYAPLVAERNATVVVQCQKELKSLLENIKGIKHVITGGDELPEFDVHCPLLSLPLIFNTSLDNIPADIPYITLNQSLIEKWKNRIKSEKRQYKIGLVWSGNPKYTHDRLRSFEITTFSPLSRIEGITFYSLQKGMAAEQIKNPPQGMKIIDFTDELHDFADTAGLVKNLDLVISVDTSVAHLAGAIGMSVWTLLPFSPDWRWMLNRDDSPWYPTMRLFRQDSLRDWTSVISEVSSALEVTMNEKSL